MIFEGLSCHVHLAVAGRTGRRLSRRDRCGALHLAALEKLTGLSPPNIIGTSDTDAALYLYGELAAISGSLLFVITPVCHTQILQKPRIALHDCSCFIPIQVLC